MAAVTSTSFDFSSGRPIGSTRLDTAYAGLTRDRAGRACIDLDNPADGRGVTLWLNERFNYVMVYTGDTLPEAKPAPVRRPRADDLSPRRPPDGDRPCRAPPGRSMVGKLGDHPSTHRRHRGARPLINRSLRCRPDRAEQGRRPIASSRGILFLVPSKVATLDDIRRAARRGQSRDRAWLVGFTVGWPLLLFVCLWEASGPGTNDVAMGVLWVGSVVTLFVIPMAAQRAYRCPRRLRVACTAGILVAIAGLVAWTLTGGMVATKLRLDQGSWQRDPQRPRRRADDPRL